MEIKNIRKAFVIDRNELNVILKMSLNTYVGVDEDGWYYSNTKVYGFNEMHSKVLALISKESKMEVEDLLVDTTCDLVILFCK